MTRIKIVREIVNQPVNANQIAEKLRLDYKTIQHHLKVLMQNGMIIAEGYYGANYFVTPEFDNEAFNEIMGKVGMDLGKTI